MPTYDELYVISDLHLGGVGKSAQIFNQKDLLTEVIDHIAAPNSSKKIALCINGDTVDFLAETKDKIYLDPDNAIKKLNRIIRDPSFSKVWAALKRFVRTANRTLIFTLGNHDLELALPWVREHLTKTLSQGDGSAAARIKYEFEGQGHRCRVGKADVFCVHGNDVDTWNVTDYEALDQLVLDYENGNANPWTPNAGTKLVIDVMNRVKARFPFVDLLKPEGIGLVSVLYCLDSSLRSEILAVGRVVPTLAWDTLRRITGFLEEEDGDSASMPPTLMVSSEQREEKKQVARQLMKNVNSLAEQGYSATDLLTANSQDSSLGYTSALIDWIRGRDQVEVLRESLESMGNEENLALDYRDSTFTQIDKLVDESVDFIVTGHTHAERARLREKGTGVYFNSGTWVRLIRLSSEVLGSERKFQNVYNAFKAGTMKALDETPRLIMKRPTVVSIVKKSSKTTVAELLRPQMLNGGLAMVPVDNSRFEKTL